MDGAASFVEDRWYMAGCECRKGLTPRLCAEIHRVARAGVSSQSYCDISMRRQLFRSESVGEWCDLVVGVVVFVFLQEVDGQLQVAPQNTVADPPCPESLG